MKNLESLAEYAGSLHQQYPDLTEYQLLEIASKLVICEQLEGIQSVVRSIDNLSNSVGEAGYMVKECVNSLEAFFFGCL